MKKWTPAEEDELRRLYPSTSTAKLAARYGVTPMAVRLKCRRLGVRRGQLSKIRLTESQLFWLKANFPHAANKVCAVILGISESSLHRFARELGLRKTARFMKESQAFAARRAKESHLRNGTYPPKGYFSPNLMKGIPHQFKPGRRSKALEKGVGKIVSRHASGFGC